MNLIFDIGNSNIKTCVFKNNTIFKSESLNYLDEDLDLNSLLESRFEEIDIYNVIISSVIGYENNFVEIIKKKFSNVLIFDEKLKSPIQNQYKTLDTLGKDRLAGVIGANYIFPEFNVLIIDAGTAITYDIINSNSEYLGGNISPGLKMRFKALNYFTKKLPMMSASDFENFIADNTNDAIICGVQNGLLYEIRGYIDDFNKKFQKNKIIFTGGDVFFFDKKVKRSIFAEPNLISIGLNRILEYNV